MSRSPKKLKIRFLGAAEGVTGSKSLIELNGHRVLVDCGLFQGLAEVRQRNWEKFPFPVESISAVVLTHAHLDHTGYLPRLVRQGYQGPIYCSEGTADLCGILLRDAAYLEAELASYANKTKYSRHDPAAPLFTQEDVENTLELLKPCKRYIWNELTECDGTLSFELHNAGHIVGASMVRFCHQDQQKLRYITFSGDLGNNRMETMRAPDPCPESDILILESTYGDRLQPRCDVYLELENVINRTMKRKGVLIIPAFAVGRAQEILYRISVLQNQKRIPTCPVVLDSPMATKATHVFLQHDEDHRYASYFGEKDHLNLPQNFEVSASTDESFMNCMRDGPLIVVTASGMLSGGRVLHHLKKRLPHPENTVLFTGYQADGTKGRYLQEHSGSTETLRIHHEEVELEAEIVTLDCLSSHADYSDTMAWLKNAPVKPKKIITNHGSVAAQSALVERINKDLKLPCASAADGDVELG